MEQLIKITKSQGGKDIVSARELYEFLDVGTKFTDWCKRMFDYGFEKNKDYAQVLLPKNEKQTKGGHNAIDYAFTVNMAKEISMIQRTEKGKLARQYFIRCEEFKNKIYQAQSLGIKEHTDVVVQKSNSKKINDKNFKEGGIYQTMNYNKKNCKAFTGFTPQEVMNEAKLRGLPSKCQRSAKETIRVIKPELACGMSFCDKLVSQNGVNHDKAIDVSKRLAVPLFKELVELGITEYLE